MSDRTPRERAESNLADALTTGGYGHAQATAIAGVGWAVLDLADAIRESRPKPEAFARVVRRKGGAPVSFVCQAEAPEELPLKEHLGGVSEATSRCVRVNGHDGDHADDTGGTWPL